MIIPPNQKFTAKPSIYQDAPSAEVHQIASNPAYFDWGAHRESQDRDLAYVAIATADSYDDAEPGLDNFTFATPERITIVPPFIFETTSLETDIF